MSEEMKGELTIKETAAILKRSKRAVERLSQKEGWPYQEYPGRGRGGKFRKYKIEELPEKTRKLIASECQVDQGISLFHMDMMKNSNRWMKDISLSPQDLEDPNSIKWKSILQEADNPPPGWGKKKWKETVAQNHGFSVGWLYKRKKTRDKEGEVALRRPKPDPAQPRVWSPEALRYWIGLNFKRAHRKITRKALYRELEIEAEIRGWNIGGYEDACWQVRQTSTSQLRAFQCGGRRGLDNALPPILRNFSDLKPFELICTDQKIWDFWITSESTGQLFKREDYLTEDLCTRVAPGMSFARNYNRASIRSALKMTASIFSLFKGIYTDLGKPELSGDIDEIVKEVSKIGFPIEHLTAPRDPHRKAGFKNPKAKPIEVLHRTLQGILRDDLKIPGYAKRLTESGEEVDIDEAEVKTLAAQGKLLTDGEFSVAILKALDIYNNRPHRGVLKEWKWQPKPKEASPLDCLKMHYAHGWRPVRLPQDILDLIFLERAERTVQKGRIAFQNEQYEAEELMKFEDGTPIQIRYDLIGQDFILVFHREKFICRAIPVEYSSMKDRALASRKIEEKERLKKAIIAQYRQLTSGIPDVRNYSKVPPLEKAAALIGRAKRKIQKHATIYEERTNEELAAEVAQQEAQAVAADERRRAALSRLPLRPAFFRDRVSRYSWIVKFEIAGGHLSPEDEAFKAEYEAGMSKEESEYWNTVTELSKKDLEVKA